MVDAATFSTSDAMAIAPSSTIDTDHVTASRLYSSQAKPPRFSCTICSYTTRYKTNLTTHTRRHLGDAGRIFKCPHCPYSTASKGDLNRHRKLRHLTQEVLGTTLKCGLCSFISTYQANLRKHFAKKHAVRRRTPSAVKPKKSHGRVVPVTPPTAMGSDAETSNNHTVVPSPHNTNNTAKNHGTINGKQTLVYRHPKSRLQIVESTTSYGNSRYHQSSSSLSSLVQDAQRTPTAVTANSGSARVHNTCETNESSIARSEMQVYGPGVSSSPDQSHIIGTPGSIHAAFQPNVPPNVSPVQSLLKTLQNYSSLNNSNTPGSPCYAPRAGNNEDRAVRSKLFACNHCSIYFADRAMFLMHRSLHNMESPFRCNLCGYEARDKYDFMAHFINHNI